MPLNWPSNGSSPTPSTWADPRTLSGVDVELRASDDDRNRVVAALHQHTAAGRLTLDEFSDRAGADLTLKSSATILATGHDQLCAAREYPRNHDDTQLTSRRRAVGTASSIKTGASPRCMQNMPWPQD